MATGTGCICC